jgi:hypothetical protein
MQGNRAGQATNRVAGKKGKK